jgi:hypothetical protein
MEAKFLRDLLDNLGSGDDILRESALRDAGGLPPDAKLKLFRMAARRYRRQQRRYRSRNFIYILLFVLWLIGVALIGANSLPEDWYGALWTGMIGGFIANSLVNRPPTRARQQLTVLGQNIDDVRFVVPLLRLLYEAEAERPDPVLADVLKRLLPQLQYRDTRRWSHEDRSLLLTPLENRSDPELTLCVLRALEQVGDESAVPTVEKLAAMRLYDPRIAPAARECLPFLYAHVEQLHLAQTLLRPTDSITDSPDNLLRPATGDADNEAYEELLRPDSHRS